MAGGGGGGADVHVHELPLCSGNTIVHNVYITSLRTEQAKETCQDNALIV